MTAQWVGQYIIVDDDLNLLRVVTSGWLSSVRSSMNMWRCPLTNWTMCWMIGQSEELWRKVVQQRFQVPRNFSCNYGKLVKMFTFVSIISHCVLCCCSDFIILPGYVDFTANEVVGLSLCLVSVFLWFHPPLQRNQTKKCIPNSNPNLRRAFLRLCYGWSLWWQVVIVSVWIWIRYFEDPLFRGAGNLNVLWLFPLHTFKCCHLVQPLR